MLQDRSGIFWIGTNGGLNRYDGTSFTQYSILSHPGLISNTITALLQDGNGHIWIGTDEGLEIMDPATDSLYPIPHPATLPSGPILGHPATLSSSPILGLPATLPSSPILGHPATLPPGPILGLRQMKDGSIWILSGNWMAKYSRNHRFTRIAIDPSLLALNKVFTAITEERDGDRDNRLRLWLSYLDQPTILAQVFHSGDNDSLGALPSSWPGYVQVYRDHAGVQWGLSPYGVDRYDTSTGAFHPWLQNTYTKNIPRLHLHTCYIPDADGDIWEGARMLSLVKYDLSGRRVDDYNWLLTAAEASMVYCLYKDDDNTIWIGTDNGIIKFSGRSAVFHNIPFVIGGVEQKEIRSRRITEADGGILYAGTVSHGLLQLSPAAGGGYTTTPLSIFGATPISALPMKDNSLSIPAGRYDIGFVYDFCQKDNTLWYAGYGIGHYDPRTAMMDIFLSDGDETTRHESLVLFSICSDGARFWLGGQFDIFVFDRVTRRMQPFTDAKNRRPFHGVSTWCVKQQGNFIWAGTSEGLYRIDPRTREVVKASALSNMNYAINDICPDTDGTFWLSTGGGGLVHFDPATGQTRQFTTADGLSNNTVCGVLRDTDGSLWISTYAGLNYFDRQSAQFTAFYAKDGLGMDEFNRKAFARLRDGRMIFGGLNGYIVFDPRAVFKAYYPSTIRLCRYGVTNAGGVDSTTVFDVDRLKQLIIHPGDKFFSLSYALTDLYDPKGDRYFYKLEGLDNVWHFIANQHTLSFMSLPPGKYTLHVKGGAAKGLPARNELVLPIEVLQVFYKRSWFLALLLFAAVILIFAIVRYRINQWKKLQVLRTKIASDLHDDIGSNLVRITLLADSANAHNGSVSPRETLDKIASISRNAVSTIKDVVWSIDARYDTMVGMIEYMHEHIHDMLSPADIDFSFRHDDLPMDDRLNMAFRQNVYLIYKESINNIVKHAGATQVDVRLQSRPGLFIMFIKDNGRGMRKEGGRLGHGLGNMQMRASRIHAKLEITSQEDGVTVSLEAPYK